jgi:hypothetical protein
MRCQWKLLAVLLAMTNLMANAEEAIPKVKIEEFSVTPLNVKVGDEVQITWRVRNVGDKPVTVQPLVGFTRPGMSHYVKATTSKQLAPSEVATFTATAQFPFGTDWGESLPGSHTIETMVIDTEEGISLGGFAYDKPLVYGKFPEYVPKKPEPGPAIISYPARSLYFAGETVSVSGKVVHATNKVESIAVSGPVSLTCPVSADGSFEFTFSPVETGLQKLILRAADMPKATVDIFVSPGGLEFPALFGTDEHYEVGLFTGTELSAWPKDMLAYWANRLGVKFVLHVSVGGFAPDANVDELLTAADRLGMTFGFVNASGGGSLAERSITHDGKSSDRHVNTLAPEFMKQYGDQLVDFVSQLRHHPSLRYVLLMPESFNLRQQEGYNPENLERFAKEVVVKKRPTLELPDVKNAPAWFKLLKSDPELWEDWLLWRERLWTNWMVEVRDRMRAIKPDVEFGTHECHQMDRGLFNMGMLVEAGVTAHGPHCNFPDAGNPYWATLITADWYYKWYGYEPFMISMSVWWDTDYDPEQIVSGLFGPVKAGGTRVPAWADSGPRFNWNYLNPDFGKGNIKKLEQWAEVSPNDEALQSPITDMLTGISNHQKAQALEQAAAQIGRLPYKHRFAIYERYGGALPLEFALSWSENDKQLIAKSKDGIAAGNPHDSVCAAVQDYHPNGYVEMLLFNDVEQSYRTKKFGPFAYGIIPSYTFEPGSLRERRITVTVKCDNDVVPFVDGKPWTYYDRTSDSLIIKSIPFEAQQVRLLQLVRCGRQIPHVVTSSVDFASTTLDVQQQRLWLRLTEPAGGDDQTIAVKCANWSKPNQITGGHLDHFDKSSSIATILVDEKAQSVDLQWAVGVPYWP